MTTPQKETTTARIALLDILRFLAAFAVMLYHYQGYLSRAIGTNYLAFMKFGYLGVNFFFMLSGFVIIASAQNRNAFKFALLRATRLYPAFIASLVVTLSALVFFNNSLPQLGIIAFNTLMINDYFNLPNIDGVYWTLQAELKFYACVFFLILSSLINKYKIWLSIWLLLTIIYFFSNQPFFLGWFINPNYSFFFIAGVAAYYFFINPKDHYASTVFIITMFFSCMKSWKQIDGFCNMVSNTDRTIACIISLVFFIFFVLLPHLNKVFKTSRIFAFLGGISYPLYLIHSRAGLEFANGIKDWTGVHMALVLTVLSVIVASSLIHLYIEKPLIKRMRIFIK